MLSPEKLGILKKTLTTLTYDHFDTSINANSFNIKKINVLRKLHLL